jgi:hypothetical protein
MIAETRKESGKKAEKKRTKSGDFAIWTHFDEMNRNFDEMSHD